jgi:hypothetical protein
MDGIEPLPDGANAAASVPIGGGVNDMTVDVIERQPDGVNVSIVSGSVDMASADDIVIEKPQQPDGDTAAEVSGDSDDAMASPDGIIIEPPHTAATTAGGSVDTVAANDIIEQPGQLDGDKAAAVDGDGDDMDIVEPQKQPSDDNAAAPVDDFLAADIIEQPVWGIDCYTRRNIIHCLEIEFDETIALLFIEKWLLPAINACPDDLAHDIANAARILIDGPIAGSSVGSSAAIATTNETGDGYASNWTSQNALGRALKRKIAAAGTVWLKPCASELLRARNALGLDFFRVHPKGHGSVVLANTIPANRLVTFYHGELYPSWRWGEKMDAIEITQKRKALKP